MKKQNRQVKSQVKWFYETHELKGRTVTIAEVVMPGKMQRFRGVSIRNPKDCPISSDGVKFALTRALKRAKVGKTQRAKVWVDFLQRFPPSHAK